METKKTRPRVCLRCTETFESTGPGNRICPACTKKTVHTKPKLQRLSHKRASTQGNN